MSSVNNAPVATLISITSSGGPSRAASELMGRYAPVVAGAMKKAIPFLTRRGTSITTFEPKLIPSSELLDGLQTPTYVTYMAAEPGGARAALVLDGHAIAFLVEGLLGGDGNNLPELRPQGLTPAQRAFAARVVEDIVAGVSKALVPAMGLKLTIIPRPEGERSPEGTFVELPLAFLDDDEGSKPFGRIILAISKSALMGLRSGPNRNGKSIDPRLSETLKQAEVELVAELGRVELTLGRLARLKVGDTLRLDVPVKGTIDVRVDDQVIYRGRPTISGSQLAIRVLGHQETSERDQTPEGETS